MSTTEADTKDEAAESPDEGGGFRDRFSGERLKSLPRRTAVAAPGTALRAVKSPCFWLVSVAFFVYAAFAYNQYRQLQVGACDLGIFYQAVQGWAFHGWPMVPIKGYTHMGDHFSPIFLVLAPLLWIHNSPLTIVFAQAALLVSSAIPVYRVIDRAWGKPTATGLTIAYLLSIGMQGSVAFPVHEVMFSAPLIAWALERALAGRWTAATVLMGLTVFVKEDMGLMCVMFAFWLLFQKKWRHSAALAVWGLAMFVLATKVLIPHYNPSGFTYSGDYAQSLHSSNFGQAIKYMFTHPTHTIHELFNQPAKRETWFRLLAPVGFICLASPIVLLGLPLMLTRMLSDRDTEWGWQLYYDMPLMPIVFIGAVDGAMRLTRLVRWAMAKAAERRGASGTQSAAVGTDADAGVDAGDSGDVAGDGDDVDSAVAKPAPAARPAKGDRRGILFGRLVGGALAVLAVAVTLNTSRTEQLNNWWNNGWFMSNATWIKQVQHGLANIPPGVKVRATNNLTVPLAARDTVTLIGSHVDDGDWAAIDTTNPQCPINASFIPPYVAELRAQGFVTVSQVGPILVMHKG